MAPLVQIDPEVERAVESGGPVVALETAVVTHGLPRPANIEIAAEMASIIRRHGAIPAIVAVVDGALHVGLDADALRELGQRVDVTKLSDRDLAWAMATGATGGTTVAGTLAACRLAGIRVFATGGIGGVHPGYARHHDASADLDALANTRCCVVSAGAKSILDLPATLEHLDALRVPVVGYGDDRFPLFFSRGTDALRTPQSAQSLEEVAQLLRNHWDVLRSATGVVLCNPIPERDAIPDEELRPVLAAAQQSAEEQGVRGGGLTPYLLAEVARRTQGRSMAANLALLRNNARTAAELATRLVATA
jgi:pseudouridine-5'-phosphate glycosidase